MSLLQQALPACGTHHAAAAAQQAAARTPMQMAAHLSNMQTATALAHQADAASSHGSHDGQPEQAAQQPDQAAQQPESYWRLLDKGEPYRLLFPAGFAFGLIGIMLWVLYVLGWPAVYPAIPHARIMIEGFLGAFAFGFLGTAFPRLTDTPRMRGWVSLTVATGLLLSTLLHLAFLTAWGDALFLATFVFFLVQLAVRIPQRKDNPPPGFVLVGVGLLCGLLGAAGLLAANFVRLSPTLYSLSSLALYQGFMLLPVMGIGAFLLPRFFALPNRQNFDESLSFSPQWLRRFAFALGCAVAVLISFYLEARGMMRSGNLLRAAAVLAYVGVEIPVHKARFSQGSLALALRIALISIPLGYIVVAIAPSWRIAWLHILFITGFSLITLTVATRVLLGHSGQSHRFKMSLRPVNIMLACLVLALLTRISADFMPDSQLTHYAYAAGTWALGAIVWAVAFLKDIRYADDET